VNLNACQCKAWGVLGHFKKTTQLTRTVIFIATFLLLSSCGTGLNVRKSQLKYFDKNFSATVDNNSFKIQGRRYGNPTLLELLEIYPVNTDSVSIKFIDSLKLQVSYMDSGTVMKKIFNGQFSKNGYYEIFLRNESKVIPIIYSGHNINRIRMALTIQGDLIVDNEWNESGHILMLGAGDSGRRQSYFKTTTVK
jgi:hypothetical protein